MHLIFSDPMRCGVDAILLAASENRMRVIVGKQDDTLEFRLIENRWISDDGTVIEIEALFADNVDTVARVWAKPRLLACAASS